MRAVDNYFDRCLDSDRFHCRFQPNAGRFRHHKSGTDYDEHNQQNKSQRNSHLLFSLRWCEWCPNVSEGFEARYEPAVLLLPALMMYVHYLPDILFLWFARSQGFCFLGGCPRRYAPVIWFAIISGWAGVALATARVSRTMNHELVQWLRCFAIVISLLLFILPHGSLLCGSSAPLNLNAAHYCVRRLRAATAIPAIVAPIAFIRRERLNFREVNVGIPNLPKALDGLRITQVSDIHLSPFLDEATLAHAIGMANETQAAPHSRDRRSHFNQRGPSGHMPAASRGPSRRLRSVGLHGKS